VTIHPPKRHLGVFAACLASAALAACSTAAPGGGPKVIDFKGRTTPLDALGDAEPSDGTNPGDASRAHADQLGVGGDGETADGAGAADGQQADSAGGDGSTADGAAADGAAADGGVGDGGGDSAGGDAKGDGGGVKDSGIACVKETCNGADDDCDGETDEDLGVLTCGAGGCKAVVAACFGGKANACVPGLPGAELCNGVDDDCDGKTDEDMGLLQCGTGACQATSVACVNGKPNPCLPGKPATEACNGVDDDCDGKTDETGASCPQPGAVCKKSKCVLDCTAKDAPPCPAGTVCTVGQDNPGACVDPKKAKCVITGPKVACGKQTCGPGSLCHAQLQQCVADLPCLAVKCSAGGCHGTACGCKRPPPVCQAAPLKALNQSGFIFGLVDFDMDLQCAAWAVTVISGPDYLRRVAPDGKLKSITGVTNLNMGEVAALQGIGSVFGGNLSQVALTYNCCAGCGCQSNTPQGVAWYDQQAGKLPMMIPTLKYSKGPGPFKSVYLDTGPNGLTWGLAEQLYVGNVDVNGDMHTIDLATKTKKKLTLLPARVYASAPFDGSRLLVALADKSIRLVHIVDGKFSSWGQAAKDITALARDPWSGVVYVGLHGGEIRTYNSVGKDQGVFATGKASGRIAVAGDNHLYHLNVAPVANASVQRFKLAETP